MVTDLDVVNNIIKLAKQRGIKQSFLNELIGGYRGKITDWKNGKSKPTDDELNTIAEYFNVSINYLLGETDDPMPPKKDDAVPADEETSYIFVMGAGGTHQKIPIPKEKLEKFNKMVELIMPELLNDDKNDDL